MDIFYKSKETSFLGRRPTVLLLCSNSAVLMRLDVGPTKDRKATDVGSSVGLSCF